MHRSRPVALSAGLVAFALALAVARPARADALPAHAVHVADYDLRVRLDPDAKTLDGQERIVWRNPAAEPVGELWFHLYLNAFKNTSSTFYRESGGRLRRDQMADDAWGFIEVKSIRRADGLDLGPGASFEHPDDDNAEDRTVWRVPLPEPVPPGGEIALDLAFEARLPRVFARTGYHRDYFLVGQWFPKLGVYEPAGRRGRPAGGWNCHQFHANSEFYADFGRYRAEITLPGRFVVGATGRRTQRRENPDGSATHVFEQADVIDFAWTASPHFVEVRDSFSAEHDVTPQEYAQAAALLGRRPEELRLGDVALTLLVQPERAAQAGRYLAAAKAAIKWFGLWYGRYPHATLTLVDPAYGASGSGGMEYPTFITLGSSLLLAHWPFDQLLLPEGVTVHEFGHQYWQGLVASNEFEEPWLDEGFNTYSTGAVMQRAYGPWSLRLLGLRLGPLESARASYSPERQFDRIRSSAWGFSPGNYAFNSYARTRLTLLTLEALIGPQAMARVLRTYHERWRFRHPGSQDFYAVVAEVTGRDYGWFFEQTVERPGLFDDEVAALSSVRLPLARGVFGEGKARTTVDSRTARGMDRQAGPPAWRSTVLLRRRGEVRLPTSLELRYEDGQTETLALPAEGEFWSNRWQRLERTGPRRLLSATLDPQDRLVLDANRLNNGRRTPGDRRVATQWGARWVFWLQQLVAAVGF